MAAEASAIIKTELKRLYAIEKTAKAVLKSQTFRTELGLPTFGRDALINLTDSLAVTKKVRGLSATL